MVTCCLGGMARNDCEQKYIPPFFFFLSQKVLREIFFVGTNISPKNSEHIP